MVEHANNRVQITAPYVLRSLGHTILCGTLHVAYQSRKTVQGKYMLCALFTKYLLLACPNQTGDKRSFQVVASIQLADMKLEGIDSGKGLKFRCVENEADI